MLAQSPSTVADADIATLEPTEPAEAAAAVPAAARRSGSASARGSPSSGWRIVLLGAIFIPILVHSNATDNALAGHSSQGFFKVASHPLGFDRNGNDMLLNLAQGRPQLDARRDRRGRLRAPRRRRPRPDRRLLPAGDRRRPHDGLQRAARDPAVRARALARHRVRDDGDRHVGQPTSAIVDRTGWSC